jgi:5S rRNA maturation endonuclease (ribonuclease M5)
MDALRDRGLLGSSGGSTRPQGEWLREMTAKANGHAEPEAEETWGPWQTIDPPYSYTDATGELLFQVTRMERFNAAGEKDKTFRQRHPDGNGGWIETQGPRRVLYRWPDLVEHPDATLFVCEGEKDADRLASLGLCATAVANGNWNGVDVACVAGRDVMVLEDADKPGIRKAAAAAEVMHGLAKALHVVRLPGQEQTAEKRGKDVSDWLDEDPARGRDELAEACFAARLWRPEPSGLGEWDAGEDTESPPPRGWLLGNIFARRFMSSLLADGGVGKTALRYAQLLSLALGRSLTGEHVFQRCKVLIVSLEDDADELKRRILALLLHYGIDRSELAGWLFLSAPGGRRGKMMTLDKNGNPVRGPLAADIEAVIVARKIDIVSIDPFVKSHSVEENSNSGIDDVVQVLTDLAANYNIALDAPHHTSKGAADPGNANRGRGASAMKDGARLVYTLTPMSTDEAKAFGVVEEERRFLVRMDSGKVNIAPPMCSAKWFRLVGVRLFNGNALYPGGDEVQAIVPWDPPDTWADLSSVLLNQILTAIDAGLPDGNRFTDARSGGERAAWRVVVEHAANKTEAQAREIIKTWVKNGVLVSYEYRNEKTRKDVTGLRLDTTKRPS